MIDRRPYADAERAEEAAAWVVRLQQELDESDLAAFDAWLQASPANGRAYDEALAVWQAYGRHASEVAEGLAARRAPRPDRRRLFIMAGGLAAAAAAAMVVLLPQTEAPQPGQTYVTGIGERHRVTLEDGSAVDLNADTRLTVAFAQDARRIELEHGQAIFDVAPDKRRPFVIAAGDRNVRVVGTQFDVRRRDGRLSVAVARGAVEVLPTSGSAGRAYRLSPGQRLDHVEGTAQAQVLAADAQEVLGWRSGRLIYRGEPLREVIADLNRQFPTPIRIDDPQVAETPISGVLVLDDQDAVIRRLALLVPLRAVRSETGVVLRREGALRP